MVMQLIIPTRGRTSDQLTLSWFSKAMRQRTTIVCPKREKFSIEGWIGRGPDDITVEAQPDADWTIAKKRVWIIQEWTRRGFNKIMMLDDDLRFATRISSTDWKLRTIEKEELEAEFNRVEEKLSPEFPHVGFGPRQGNQNIPEPGWKIPGKTCYTLGYYLPIVSQMQLGRIEIREDMELNLQLLTKGYASAVWNETVCDQRKYDAPGGASKERTVEFSNEQAVALSHMYPDYVTITERKYKESVPRIEVIVQWKKALEDGLRNRKTGG
jgi:hypothetical protein